MEQNPLPVGTVLKGRFVVKRLIGGGGMSLVYQVEERRPDGTTQIWAMKELRLDSGDALAQQEAYQLFEQEAHILANLEHPHLPKVTAFFNENGRSYLVMDFIPGESLKKRLQTANAPLLESQVLDWAIQICDVLAYLHSREPPIIFRDMKPSNVMVTPEGVIKLIDFGIARTYKKGKLKDTLAMGTENYAAPEQWGKAQSDARTDIYALGATMYHLLTNVPPAPAFVPTPSLPLRSYNPAVSEATARVVEKAMARDPAQRYPSALAMKKALVACLPPEMRQQYAERAESASQAPQPTPTVQPRPAPRPAPPIPQPRPTPQPKMPTPQPKPAPQFAPPATPPKPPAAPQRACPRCQTLNPSVARFCRRCGHSLLGLRPAVIRIVHPPGVMWEMPLRGKSLILGRDPEESERMPFLDLAFYDPHRYLSERHAVIMQDGETYAISDLGSVNGTKVNGVYITPRRPRPLHNGDEIQIGQIKLRFELR